MKNFWDFPTLIKHVAFCPEIGEYAQYIVKRQYIDRLTQRMAWEESALSLYLIHVVPLLYCL